MHMWFSLPCVTVFENHPKSLILLLWEIFLLLRENFLLLRESFLPEGKRFTISGKDFLNDFPPFLFVGKY